MLRSAGGGGSARAAAAQHRRALARAPHACLCARMVKRAETCMMYGQDVARQMVSGFPSCTAVDQQVTHGASCSPGAPSAGTAGMYEHSLMLPAPARCRGARLFEWRTIARPTAFIQSSFSCGTRACATRPMPRKTKPELANRPHNTAGMTPCSGRTDRWRGAPHPLIGRAGRRRGQRERE